MNDIKTFTINTMDETKYKALQKSGKLRPNQLYIVDDDSKNRLVIPSFDVIENERTRIKELSATINDKTDIQLEYSQDDGKIKLVNKNEIISEIETDDFIKDGMLSAAEWDSENKIIKLTFNTDAGAAEISVDLFETITSIEENISDISNAVALSVDTMSSHIALSVDEISNAVALSVDEMSSSIALSVDNLCTDIGTMSSHIALSVDQISAATALSIDTMSSHIALSVDQISAAIALSVDEISTAVALSVDQISNAVALSVDEMSTAISLSVYHLSTDLYTMSSHTAVSVDEISNAVALSIDNLYTDIDDMSTAISLSVDEMSSSIALSVDNLCTDISTMSSHIALSVDTVSNHIALSVDQISNVVALSVGTMSSHIALSVDEISTAVALSVDQISNAIALSVAEISAGVALSVDTMSSHIALSVDRLSNYIDSLDEKYMADTYKIFNTVVQKDGRISADFKTLDLNAISGMDVLLERVSNNESEIGNLNQNLADEIAKRAANDGYLSGQIDTINGITIPNAITSANTYTDSQFRELAHSQPSKDNKLITEKDIAKFDNIMHFVGTLTSDEPIPISSTSSNAWGDLIYKPGDVRVSMTSGKEFVFLSSDETGSVKYWWEVIGDQNTYLTKASFTENWNSMLLSVDTMSSHIAVSVDNLETKTNSMSAATALSVNGISSSVALSVDEISSAIRNKVKVGDYGQELSAVNELSIVHIDRDEYYRMTKLGQLDQKTVYILSGNSLNAYGMPIKNVGSPSSECDAVNLSTLTVLSGDLTDKINDEVKEFAGELYTTIHPILSNVTTDSLDLGALADAVLQIYSTLSGYVNK